MARKVKFLNKTSPIQSAYDLQLKKRSIIVAPILIFIFQSFLFSQTNHFKGWDKIHRSTFKSNPDKKVLRNFRIPESTEAERLIHKAKAHIEAKEYIRAVYLLDKVIKEKGDNVFQVAVDSPSYAVKGCARFAGAAALAFYMLKNLPSEGKEVYEAYVEDKAGDRLERAIKRRDFESVRLIGETYTPSSIGKEAYSFLAEHHLEKGETEIASLYMKEVLLYNPDSCPVIKARLVQALDQLGEEKEKKAMLESNSGLSSNVAKGLSFDEDLARNPTTIPINPNSWLTCGGDNSRCKQMPLLVDAKDYQLQWRQDFLAQGDYDFNPFNSLRKYIFERRNLVPFNLLRSGKYLIVNNTISINAYDIYTGELIWRYAGPHEKNEDRKNYYRLEDYFSSERGGGTMTTISPYLIAGGTIAENILLVNLQGLRKKKIARTLNGRVINKAIPGRGLFALSLIDGELLWAHGDKTGWEDGFMDKISISSPPLVVGDRVYCSAYLKEGGINTYLLCFDLKSGRMIRKVSVGIGQHELTMFNMEYKEFCLPPLSESEGVIIFNTNLGFICGLDSLSCKIRWITEYDTIDLPKANLYHVTRPRIVWWANNPPIIHRGRSIVTPLDSKQILCLDLYTGKPYWSRDADSLATDFYPFLIGVDDSKVILSGDSGALALRLSTGARAWRTLPLDRIVKSRSIISNDKLYAPVDSGLFVYDLKTGKTIGRRDINLIDYRYNLFFMGEVMALAGGEYIGLYFNRESMLTEARKRCVGGKGGVKDLSFMGDMYVLSSDYKQAVDYYNKAVIAASTDREVQRSELDKIIKSLHDAYIGLGLYYNDINDAKKAEAAFHSALEGAVNDSRYVEAALKLVSLFEESGDDLSLIGLLDEMFIRCADKEAEYPAGSVLYKGRIGLYVLASKLEMAMAKKDVGAQVEALQKIVESYPDEDFNGVRAWDLASERLKKLIKKEGRQIYAAYNKKAEKEFYAALNDSSVASLSHIVRNYPNAEIYSRAVIEIARLHLQDKSPSAVYLSLSDFLKNFNDSPDFPHALHLMSQAAEMEGNFKLASALKNKLFKSFGDKAAPWSEGVTYGGLYKDYEIQEFAEKEVPTSPISNFKVQEHSFESECRFVIPDGVQPPFIKGKILLLVGTYDYRKTKYAKLTLFDYKTEETVWSLPLNRYQDVDKKVQLIYMNDLMIAVFSTVVVGLDIESGDPVWALNLNEEEIKDGSVIEEGLLCILSDRMDRDLSEDRIIIRSVNPVSGEVIWKKEMKSLFKTEIIPAEGVFCICTTSKIRDRAGSRLNIFDPITGSSRAQIQTTNSIIEPLPFPSPRGRIVVTHEEIIKNTIMRELRAYSTESGDLIWFQSLDSWSSPNFFLRIGNKIAFVARERANRSHRVGNYFSYRSIDCETGKLDTPLSLPKNTTLITVNQVVDTDYLMLESSSRTRSVTLTSFSPHNMEYSFEKFKFPVGDRTSGNRMIRKVIYCKDVVVVPVDFSVRMITPNVLYSQVLIIHAKTGDLLHVHDIYDKGEGGNTALHTRRYPVEVIAKDGAVFALKRSDLYIIKGDGP